MGIALAVTLVVLGLDQGTKYWVSHALDLHQAVVVIPGFCNLVLVHNRGAAFGMLHNAGDWGRSLLVVVACVALAALAAATRAYRGRPLHLWALGMIGGGAAGNLLDRLRLGVVVDFLDFFAGPYHWPAFNLADSAITVGVGLFLLAEWRGKTQHDKKR